MLIFICVVLKAILKVLLVSGSLMDAGNLLWLNVTI